MLDVFQCGHPLHTTTTLYDCKRCEHYKTREDTVSNEIANGKVEPKRPECNDARKDMTPEEMIALIKACPPGPWPAKKDGGKYVEEFTWAHWDCTKEAMRRLVVEYLRDESPVYPGHYSGRGIVIAAGGPRYFPSAWVCVRKLRHMGVDLPIQLWYLGDREVDPFMKRLLQPYGVECVDARKIEKLIPARVLCGWELKVYATAFSPFKEVMFLDADCVPAKDPTYMFECEPYKERGSVFFPDFDHQNVMGRMKAALCEDLGVAWRNEPSFESGQYLVNKERCWTAINLAWWMAEHSDYYFVHVYGDKELFHVGWRRVGLEYSMPSRGPGWDCGVCIIQHDFKGDRLFLHRCQDKWRLEGNKKCPMLEDEDLHHGFVAELKSLWSGRMWHNPAPNEREKQAVQKIAGMQFRYIRHPAKDRGFAGDERQLEFLHANRIGHGAADCELRWDINEVEGEEAGQPSRICLTVSGDNGPTFHAYPTSGGRWRGEWLSHERCTVDLIPSVSDGPEGLDSEIAGLLERRGYTVNGDLVGDFVRRVTTS